MKQDTFNFHRRSFLRGAGLTMAGLGVTSLFPSPLIRHAMAGPTDAGGKRLLFIFLRGGNDGINTVIPHGDPDYNTTTRPTLYVSPSEAIDLNGFASLNPGLGDLLPMWNAGDLAAVHRVGYPNMSRSHFDGQRIWENGDPSQAQLFEGWLYRYIRENAVSAGVDLPVLTVQSTPPLVVRGDESFVNVANPDSFDYLDPDPFRSKYANAWRRLHADLDGLEANRPILSQTGVKLADTLDEYRAWDQANWNPTDPDTGWNLFPVSDDTNPDDPGGPNGKKFPAGAYGFFRSLKLCALSLLESTGTSTNGTRIAGTQLGGWDTHENQGTLAGTQATLLSYVGYGIRSLRIALSGAAGNEPRGYASIWPDTTVVTMSEFGRTTVENGSLGTDHAAASCQFVAGGNVNGGLYNCDPTTWPAGVMLGVEGRYLLERTDYRSVFWELLRDHMGADPATVEDVFPGYGALGLPSQELGLITST
jgi:uncharacterized protein (DUF1501 family)